MLIETAIQSALSADAGVAALVGDRIYYTRAIQDTAKPYIVFSKVGGVRMHTHQGAAGLVHARFQFSAFAETYIAAKNVQVEVQDVLQGFQGTLGGAGGVEVYTCHYENEIDFYEDDTRLYHVAADYMFWYSE